MRFSQPLYKQHIGWGFQKLWSIRRERQIINTNLESKLEGLGIPIEDPKTILYGKKVERQKIDVIGYKPKPVAFDETHPNWHNRVLLTYKDHNVLLEGLSQAKILTNTVEPIEGLPESVTLNSVKEINKRVREIIFTSHVFDSEQKKLPKLRDPERPAWNFPRVYGITQDRRNKLLLTNLLHLLENTSDTSMVRERCLINDLLFSYNFEKYGHLIQFELKGNILLTSSKPLPPVAEESGTNNVELPDIFPIKPTVTLTEENIYELRNVYPIDLKIRRSHPHTLYVYHNDTEVKNLFDEEVTETQIHGRSLLKAFTVAASYARVKYGESVKDLPQPVTIQCVNTNGQLFHFGIFQLNTLDLDNKDKKNLWYQTKRIPLFERCCYKVGKPVLEGYNSDVVEYLKAFYNNV